MNIVFMCDFCGQPLPDALDLGNPVRPLIHEDCLEVLADIGREVIARSPEAAKYLKPRADGGTPTLPLALLPEAQRCMPSAMIFPVIIRDANNIAPAAYTAPIAPVAPRRSRWDRFVAYLRNRYDWLMEES